MTAGQVILRDTFKYHRKYTSEKEANERAIAALFMVIDSGMKQAHGEEWIRQAGLQLRRILFHATEGRRILP